MNTFKCSTRFKCCNTTKKRSALSIVCWSVDTFGFFDEGLQKGTAIFLKSDLRIHFARGNKRLEIQNMLATHAPKRRSCRLLRTLNYLYIWFVILSLSSRCSYVAHVGRGLSIRELTFLVNQSISSACEVAVVSSVHEEVNTIF